MSEELTNREHFELLDLRKRFKNLDKPTQELLETLERYEKALKTIAWSYSALTPTAWIMREKAIEALKKPKK